MRRFVEILCLATAVSLPSIAQTVDPCTQNIKLTGGTTFTSNSSGNRVLSGSPYGYEMWTQGGNNNRLTWYGTNQGGGAAFKAEWNNPNIFCGLIALAELQTIVGKNYSYTFNQGKFPIGFYMMWMHNNGSVEQAKLVIPK